MLLYLIYFFYVMWRFSDKKLVPVHGFLFGPTLNKSSRVGSVSFFSAGNNAGQQHFQVCHIRRHLVLTLRD